MSATIPNCVTIHPRAVDVIEREIASAPAGIETGGILLGQRIGGEVEIRVAGEPGPKAIRQRRYFLRDLDHAQQLAAAAWSEHRAQWVGEWHTHPNTGLAPSEFDLDTYRKHLCDDELGFDVFVSVIARSTKTGTRLIAWAITPASVERLSLRS